MSACTLVFVCCVSAHLRANIFCKTLAQSQLSTLTASVDNVRKSVYLCGDRTKKVEDRIDSVGKDCSQIQQQVTCPVHN